jgi:hypothetical protein
MLVRKEFVYHIDDTPYLYYGVTLDNCELRACEKSIVYLKGTPAQFSTIHAPIQ